MPELSVIYPKLIYHYASHKVMNYPTTEQRN